MGYLLLISAILLFCHCISSDAKSLVPGDIPETELKLDLDAWRNVSEIIRSRSFECQEYNVTTRDGYILTIQRIINPLFKPEARLRMKPILMFHGLFVSSVEWILDSPNVKPEIRRKGERVTPIKNNNGTIDTQEHPNALGYYMANRGYDVWLGNNRCNLYGMKHVNMSAKNPKFWDFSLDELIEFDLPDTIDFVRKFTGKAKIGYVGHSQGTFTMFGLLSSRPEYAEVIEPYVALAPVSFVKHTKAPLRLLSAIESVFRHISGPFFAPATLLRSISPILCETKFLRRALCENVIFLFSGFNSFEINLERSDAYLAHVPAGASFKQGNHFLQMINSGRFSHYNHGRRKNRLMYKQSKAPDYPLANIRSKSMALFVSSNDWASMPRDVAKLLSSLTVQPYAIYNISKIKPRWNHLDFVHSINTGEIINPMIEKVFLDFDNESSSSA